MPLFVIPAALLLAMATVHLGIGACVPAPPTVALSSGMALIWGGMALQVWTAYGASWPPAQPWRLKRVNGC